MRNINQILKAISTTLVLLLLNTFGLAGHAAAMPPAAHEMSGMSHAASGPQSCATLCRTAIIEKDEAIRDIDNEKDDDTLPEPYYVQLQNLLRCEDSLPAETAASTIKPPPKIPIHLLNGVLRN